MKHTTLARVLVFLFMIPLAGVEDCTSGTQLLQVHNLHGDALGSVSLVSAASGAGAATVIEQTFVTPFGQVAAREGNRGDSVPAHGFADHEHDAESGLYYMKARYYDPEVGRFVSPDPALNDGSTVFHSLGTAPQRLNSYTYVENKPLTHRDPDGREGKVVDLLDYLERRVEVTAEFSKRTPVRVVDITDDVWRLQVEQVRLSDVRRVTLDQVGDGRIITKHNPELFDRFQRLDQFSFEEHHREVGSRQRPESRRQVSSRRPPPESRAPWQHHQPSAVSQVPTRAALMRGLVFRAAGPVSAIYSAVSIPIWLDQRLDDFAVSSAWRAYSMANVPFKYRALDLIAGSSFGALAAGEPVWFDEQTATP